MSEVNFAKFIPCNVFIRSIEGKSIFSNAEDCSRFVFQLYAANVGRPGFNIFRRNIVDIADKLLNGEELPKKIVIKEGIPLVDILSFALNSDHAHLILSPNVENGIAKYIHKLNVSFAKYYNMKYKREGVLFNKPYKSIPLKTNTQLDYVIRYVNIKNPLDIYNPQWEKGIENWKKAFDFIESYKYSSYPDLFGIRNSKLISSRAILHKYLGKELSKDKIENIDFIENYLNKNLIDYHPLFLE